MKVLLSWQVLMPVSRVDAQVPARTTAGDRRQWAPAVASVGGVSLDAVAELDRQVRGGEAPQGRTVSIAGTGARVVLRRSGQRQPDRPGRQPACAQGAIAALRGPSEVHLYR